MPAHARGADPPLESDDDEDDPEYDSRLIDDAERPDAYVMRQELAVVIQAAIGQLPPDQRTALVSRMSKGWIIRRSRMPPVQR